MAGAFMRRHVLGLAGAGVLAAAADADAQFLRDRESPENDALYASLDGRIVLLYGPGIEGAESEAAALVALSYPASAMSGGQPSQVLIFMNGRSINAVYDQNDLDTGVVGSHAAALYDAHVRPEYPDIGSPGQ